MGAGETAADWIAVGRACQRFALQATALGLKHAFINQPVEVPRLRADLAARIGTPGRRPDVVMRLGYGPTLPWSLRHSVDAVIVPGELENARAEFSPTALAHTLRQAIIVIGTPGMIWAVMA